MQKDAPIQAKETSKSQPARATEHTLSAVSAVQQRAALLGRSPSGVAGSAAGQSEELLQLRGAGTGDVHAAAALGTSGSGGAMPFGEQIQASFGQHDISNVQAFTGPNAEQGCDAMGAEAFATGTKVAFGTTPTLHTAAHEAAHTVQQKGGISLAGGVGKERDQYERQADAVADLVVQGKSAEALLGPASGGSTSAAVQRVKTDKAETEALSPAVREKLISRTRDLIPLAGSAYMKACRDYEKKLQGAAKKKANVATMALEVALAFIPPNFSTAAKNALMGISSKLSEAALAAAVKKAESSIRGGLLRANSHVWGANLKSGLAAAVSTDPSTYVSTIERLAPSAFQNAIKGINDTCTDAELIANAGYWGADSVVDPSHWESPIKMEVMKFQMTVDAINWPGMDFSPGGPPGHAVYIVDSEGKPTKGHGGATMMVVNFLFADETEIMLYINPGLEGAAIAQHTSEYGAAPSQKFIAGRGRAHRYKK
ncbi:MAG: hypothetical protein ACI9U2_001059 [Bradymonadia bacterium]|jgi:hypothetical protein